MKEQTDTQYDNTARFDGQRFGTLKLATWNVRGIAGKMEELQTVYYYVHTKLPT